MTDKQRLNSLRKMAGIPQDFTPDRKKTVTEDTIPGMSQILRGGGNKFYLVTDAQNMDELGDILVEVDTQALINIIVGASQRNPNFKNWELFPHNNQKQALDEARTRLVSVTETIGYGASTTSPDNTPEPSQDEIRRALRGEEDEDELDDFDIEAKGDEFSDEYNDDMMDAGAEAGYDPEDGEDMSDEDALALSDFARDSEDEFDEFEPATNICPACEGEGCEECEGTGEVFEGKKDKPDFADIDKDGNKKESAKKAAKDKKKDVKEAAHYHTSGNYPATHKDAKSDVPHNVDAQYDTIWDKDPDQSQQQGNDYQMANDTTPVKVPAKVLSELKRVIDELKAESNKHKRNNLDWESAHYYEDTAEAFQTVYDHLAMKTVEGLKKAQYYSHRMMNIQRVHMPDLTWKFIVDGGAKRSLKSYISNVKEPTTGKPFAAVPTDTLNKNTHTQ